PKLRNNIMLLLSGKKASELITREGKQTLTTEIRDLVNDILDPGVKFDPDQSPVREVLFTSFIIQ
ncbi:MAG: flagellar basal body-associated FliL family protein, partial [Deltaproteobacteria bacterium]|nr:flagellar basal body-associated FliL family protein [Deltaproteobacteria bacterium]